MGPQARPCGDIAACHKDFVECMGRTHGADPWKMRGELASDESLHFAVPRTDDEIDGEDAVIGDGGGERVQDRGIPRMWAKDIGFSREVNVVYDNIELPGVVCNPFVGVGDMDFDACVIERHVPARERDEFPVNIHRGESRLGEEMAENAEGGASGEAEHEDGAGRGFSKQCARGDHVPRQAGEEFVAVEPGADGSLDAEFHLDAGRPDFDGLPARG